MSARRIFRVAGTDFRITEAFCFVITDYGISYRQCEICVRDTPTGFLADTSRANLMLETPRQEEIWNYTKKNDKKQKPTTQRTVSNTVGLQTVCIGQSCLIYIYIYILRLGADRTMLSITVVKNILESSMRMSVPIVSTKLRHSRAPTGGENNLRARLPSASISTRTPIGPRTQQAFGTGNDTKWRHAFPRERRRAIAVEAVAAEASVETVAVLAGIPRRGPITRC